MKDYQNILFPYAYNILGSAEDARDAIQDVLAKYYAEPREGIANEKAYLIKSVINQAINKKQRRKLVPSSEVWLPEPVATESADANVYLKDILSYSLLVLLEKLNAKERAVFILKESFDYGHEEIADILSITEEHSRKLLSRAKARLFKPGESQRNPIHDAHTNVLLQNYIDAIRARNMDKLEALLAEDIAFYADGGGKINVVRKICTGAPEVAELLALVYHTYQLKSTIRFTEVNYQPALLFYNGSRLISCVVFDISPAGDRIVQINAVVDPEKLKNINS
ncbi:sigma-70 family RNA polymerase sigma factor [Puia dinghuensis]|uniref:RNA polymerase sigma24 factor n=1 Tax=Puia dinghuensis TaxID=1792502 RepID=A0A8J2UCL6_9BACT|nr:sigma-70 family RNA polymerase sigma factor [Puia dinghuensis]GGA98438.1 RNA polymerase sigma24 factor [Puia dinghuensis]